MEKIIAENLDLTIEDIAEGLIKASEVKGRIPTDKNGILDYLELKQLSFDFMEELELVPKVPEKKDIRAILSFNDRTIATHSKLHKKRTTFSILHEVGHYILPEHIERLYLCSMEDLSYYTKLRLEAEANRLAANLIFQVDHFTEKANNYPLECKTITKLAAEYDASFEATARRYVEKHFSPCALIVYEKMNEYADDLEFNGLPVFEIQYTIASKLFRAKYFTKVLEEKIIPGQSMVYEAYKKLDATKTVEEEISINIIGTGEIIFDSELFTNGYKVFRLVYPKK